MKTKSIKIQVSEDAAQLYEAASTQEKRKLDALLSSRLRETARFRQKDLSLEEIMNKMSYEAQKRGLTKGKLDKILDEK